MLTKKTFFAALAILMILAVLSIGASTTVFAASDLVLISYTNDARSTSIKAVVKNNGPAKDITLVMHCYNAKGEIIAIDNVDGHIGAKSTKDFYLINGASGPGDNKIEVFIVQNYGTGLMLVSHVNNAQCVGINTVLTNGGPAKDVTVIVNCYNADGEIISTDREDGRIEQNSSKRITPINGTSGPGDSRIEVFIVQNYGTGLMLVSHVNNAQRVGINTVLTNGGPAKEVTVTANCYNADGEIISTRSDAGRIEQNSSKCFTPINETSGPGDNRIEVLVDGATLPLANIPAIPVYDPTSAAAPTSTTATPTSSSVTVNGKAVAFDAYNINGNNYFKLRDLAYTLNGTGKQFAVGWDGAKNAISLTSRKSYTPIGGEMAGKGSGNQTATLTSSRIYLDGKEVSFTAYNIGGNNYFKLRDIGKTIDFNVSWDGANNRIVINTSESYTPD